jgi:hypothetical protein
MAAIGNGKIETESADDSTSERISSDPIIDDLNAMDSSIRQVRLRLPAALIIEIDEAISRKRSFLSRHQWILEALYEKLDKEQSLRAIWKQL